MDRGCARAGCLHNTGEGGLRSTTGTAPSWSSRSGPPTSAAATTTGASACPARGAVAANPVRAIEIKLSQGAKPGVGGMLPAAKVTPAIAAARGVPVGRDCESPPGHSEFADVPG